MRGKCRHGRDAFGRARPGRRDGEKPVTVRFAALNTPYEIRQIRARGSGRVTCIHSLMHVTRPDPAIPDLTLLSLHSLMHVTRPDPAIPVTRPDPAIFPGDRYYESGQHGAGPSPRLSRLPKLISLARSPSNPGRQSVRHAVARGSCSQRVRSCNVHSQLDVRYTT